MLIETVAEKLAVRMLADSGDAVIQNAVIAAAAAKVAGKPKWLRRCWIAEAGERLSQSRKAASAGTDAMVRYATR